MLIDAAVIRAKGGPFIQEQVELDDPRPDEVLVRIVATGMCHSDLHVVHQHYPLPLPWVLGHEGAGVVERVGREVAHVERGDHVVLSFASCGRCGNCNEHQPAYCEKFLALNIAGSRQDGAGTIKAADGSLVHGCFFSQSSFASHALAHASNVIKVPRQAPLQLLGPLGCGIQTGAGAVLNVLKPAKGSSIAIFGAGAVGLAALMAAVIAGCRTIVAVDRVPSRLDLAMTLGATHIVDAGKTDAVATLLAMGGMDYTVEAVGSSMVVDAAVRSLRTRGTCAVLGITAPGVTVPIDIGHLGAGRTVMGITEGSADPQQFVPYLAQQLIEGRLPIERISRYYDLKDINQAMRDSEAGITVKPIIRISEV